MIPGKQLLLLGAIALLCSLLLGRFLLSALSCIVIVIGIVDIIKSQKGR